MWSILKSVNIKQKKLIFILKYIVIFKQINANAFRAVKEEII